MVYLRPSNVQFRFLTLIQTEAKSIFITKHEIEAGLEIHTQIEKMDWLE